MWSVCRATCCPPTWSSSTVTFCDLSTAVMFVRSRGSASTSRPTSDALMGGRPKLERLGSSGARNNPQKGPRQAGFGGGVLQLQMVHLGWMRARGAQFRAQVVRWLGLGNGWGMVGERLGNGKTIRCSWQQRSPARQRTSVPRPPRAADPPGSQACRVRPVEIQAAQGIQGQTTRHRLKAGRPQPLVHGRVVALCQRHNRADAGARTHI